MATLYPAAGNFIFYHLCWNKILFKTTRHQETSLKILIMNIPRQISRKIKYRQKIWLDIYLLTIFAYPRQLPAC